MNKTILIFAYATFLFCATGCSKESEYENCLHESLKNVPALFSRSMIEKSMEKFRAMSADEQKKALEDIKAKLAK